MHDTFLPSVDHDIRLLGGRHSGYDDVLSEGGMNFIASLERSFRATRRSLLRRRYERQVRLNAGEMPDFPEETRFLRQDDAWKVGTIPGDLQDRRVEITGPVERKMMINALNSGANVFMADFEDANAPTWGNVLQGQRNLVDAVAGTISYRSPEGKRYSLREKTAVLVVRPRGWHLEERHVLVDGEPISASLFDFGLFLFHNAVKLLEHGSGPYFYLPKIESAAEAQLWDDVFCLSEDMLGIPRGSIKGTVLIETILAAFEMEEILYALKDHIVGLNAGRWDYLFSIIKKFARKEDFLFPDRSQLAMTLPFLRAYTSLLVTTCHKRGAHAIGGMAAFIPSRHDAGLNEIALARVTEDKVRESLEGFDGTWVAHPDLVPVARTPFDSVLGSTPHQKHHPGSGAGVTPGDLLNFSVHGGVITESGLRQNISVGLQYLTSWLGGAGAVGINNLMEDAATAEISRSQVWQWLHHRDAILKDGRRVTPGLINALLEDEVKTLRSSGTDRTRLDLAARLSHHIITAGRFTEFLTIEAYPFLE